MAVGEGSVWVANAGDGTVSRIDPETAELVGAPIGGRREPARARGRRGLGVGRERPRRHGDADRSVVRGGGGEPIRVGKDPIGIAAGGGAVWTANFHDDTVTRIKP